MTEKSESEGRTKPLLSRRRYLAATGTLAIGGLAGCFQDGGNQSGDGGENTNGTPTKTPQTSSPTAATCDSPTTLSPSDVKDGGTISAGCYRVEKTLTVETGTLTVEPAVIIQFTNDVGLHIEKDGRLQVSGTEENPVRLTGTEKSRGFWKGVQIRNSNSADNILERTILEYAGSSAWNPNYSSAGLFLRGENVRLSIQQSTFRGNANVGVTVTKAGAQLDVDAVLFEENEAPLYMPANLVRGLGAGTAFMNNDEGVVYLGEPSGAGRTTVTEPADWPALDVPYQPRINVHVEAPVEVAPGARFAFEQGKGMQIRGEGRLTADATGGDPIFFSGTEDITGFWKGLYFVNSLSSDNVIKNTVIENGGSGETVGGGAEDVANLFLHGDQRAAAVTISDSTIRGSGKYGIAIRDGNSRVMGCDGMAFENNSGPDAYNLESGTSISSCQ